MVIKQGGEPFDRYYKNLYGPRWESLRKALFDPPAVSEYREGLIAPYRLGRASILAARALILPDEGLVLDACAAPGGKSLVIASLMGKGVRLLSNELSGERRRRLREVLNGHLDQEKRARVTVSGFDAAKAAGRKSELERFAGVLLDVPCSSERHVIRDKTALARWTEARPRFLARRQWSLLSAAFLLVKTGASLVYATCAISPEENDGVAARLLEKYRDRVSLDEPDFPEGEKTRFGRLILPDHWEGMGPMYVARFKKLPP